MSEHKKIAIVDKDGGNKTVSVIESTANPGVFGIVVVKSDGSKI